jgi:hypothetical protein
MASYEAWPGLREATDRAEALNDECSATLNAIRFAEASSFYGIGVKLAAFEGDAGNGFELEEAANDALRQIARLTGEQAFAEVAAKFLAWDDTSADEDAA